MEIRNIWERFGGKHLTGIIESEIIQFNSRTGDRDWVFRKPAKLC